MTRRQLLHLIGTPMTAPQFRYSKMSLRYELSAKGLDILGRRHSRGGYVVGESKDKTCWRVIPDGNKYPYAVHKSFIRVEEPSFITNAVG